MGPFQAEIGGVGAQIARQPAIALAATIVLLAAAAAAAAPFELQSLNAAAALARGLGGAVLVIGSVMIMAALSAWPWLARAYGRAVLTAGLLALAAWAVRRFGGGPAELGTAAGYLALIFVAGVAGKLIRISILPALIALAGMAVIGAAAIGMLIYFERIDAAFAVPATAASAAIALVLGFLAADHFSRQIALGASIRRAAALSVNGAFAFAPAIIILSAAGLAAPMAAAAAAGGWKSFAAIIAVMTATGLASPVLIAVAIQLAGAGAGFAERANLNLRDLARSYQNLDRWLTLRRAAVLYSLFLIIGLVAAFEGELTFAPRLGGYAVVYAVAALMGFALGRRPQIAGLFAAGIFANGSATAWLVGGAAAPAGAFGALAPALAAWPALLLLGLSRSYTEQSRRAEQGIRRCFEMHGASIAVSLTAPVAALAGFYLAGVWPEARGLAIRVGVEGVLLIALTMSAIIIAGARQKPPAAGG